MTSAVGTSTADPAVTTPETAMRHLSDVLAVLADRGIDIDSAPPAVLVAEAIGEPR